jgi:tRNA(Ile)-lysidine synthase
VPADDQPITAAECEVLFKDVRLPVALAVSGGPDSTALMQLIAIWAKAGERRGGVPADAAPVLVITVDHGLRSEAAAEAEWVSGQAVRLGFKHVTLRWTDPKPRTGIQEAAREARYRLILEHVGSEPLPQPRQVLLAHHLDDQAETVLMRLARGSGVDGLSGMREREVRLWLHLGHPVQERKVELLRPLLSIPKSRLIATLEALGAEYLQDPSNRDVRFERVRLRAAGDARAALGLTSDKLALAARRLASARDALERVQRELAHEAVDLHEGAWASIDAEKLVAAPPEVAMRLLQAVIGAFGGQPTGPDRSQVETLLEQLTVGNQKAVTLGGAVIRPGSKDPGLKDKARPAVAVYREPGRRPLPMCQLSPGEGVFWDRRFYVSASPELRSSVRVAPLGQGGFAQLKREYPALRKISIPAVAAVGLPSVWSEDRLLAVPYLSYAETALRGPIGAGNEPLISIRFATRHVHAIYGA